MRQTEAFRSEGRVGADHTPDHYARPGAESVETDAIGIAYDLAGACLEADISVRCRVLLQPELTIPSIAFRCGYSPVQNFNATFRQLTATTPAAYRREALQHRIVRAVDRHRHRG